MDILAQLADQRVASSGGHSVDGSSWFQERRVVLIAVCWRSRGDERRLRRAETAHRVRRRVVHSSERQTSVLVHGRPWAWRGDCSTDTHTHTWTDRHTETYITETYRNTVLQSSVRK